MSRDSKPRNIPGAAATSPEEIPPQGWWQVTRRAWREASEDQVPLMAAGVAFYSFLALFPTMIAAVLLYGLVRDPAEVRTQAEELTRALPADAASLLTDQLEAIAATPSESLGLGLLVAMAAALAILYRIAPDRDDPKFRWVSVGAVVATVVWLVASLGFSLYVDNFGSYNDTYGALAGVVVLLLWLWLTMYVVLLGAEINAEAEQQTVRDTTVGPPQPLGQRGAVKADSVPWEDTPSPRQAG